MRWISPYVPNIHVKTEAVWGTALPRYHRLRRKWKPFCDRDAERTQNSCGLSHLFSTYYSKNCTCYLQFSQDKKIAPEWMQGLKLFRESFYHHKLSSWEYNQNQFIWISKSKAMNIAMNALWDCIMPFIIFVYSLAFWSIICNQRPSPFAVQGSEMPWNTMMSKNNYCPINFIYRHILSLQVHYIQTMLLIFSFFYAQTAKRWTFFCVCSCDHKLF